MSPETATGRRVVIVDGVRTPFVKAGTHYAELGPIELGSAATAELVARTSIEPGLVDLVVMGAVVADFQGPNIAREVAAAIGLPLSTDAFSVSKACATGTQAIVSAAQSILSGDADVAIAGGADSLSRPPIPYSDNAIAAFMDASKAKDLASRAKALSQLRPGDLVPSASVDLRDMASGLSMGEAAEKMARENGITRESQDVYAAQSHHKAHEAWEKGIFDDEVMPFSVPPRHTEIIERDTIIRPDTDVEALARLRPVFDRDHGTVTAGNASPLTDGAAVLMLMDEATADKLGYTPRAYIRSWGFAGLDPAWQMLMGPAFAVPIALDKAGLSMTDIDVVDLHEAFAAQMLSNLAAFASDEWAQQHLGRDEAIGEIDLDTLNLYGGSIALGHPFAATGARQAITMANELARRDHGRALVAQCAAGGLGAALVLER